MFTPLVELAPAGSGLYAKLEYLHPSGSIKHRAIPAFLEAMRKAGELPEKQPIAIRSAGSAAVTTAWAGARLDFPVTAVLPPSAAPNIIRLAEWLGARCELAAPDEAVKLMASLRAHCYVLDQAAEPRLIDYYRPVAAEILAQLPETAAITVGIGTGLAITGIAREIRDHYGGTRVYGTEPAEAPVATGGAWAPHSIPGLAPPFSQDLLDRGLLAGIILVTGQQAWEHARSAARDSGLLLGPSAGAAVAAAVRLRSQGLTGPVVAVCACSIGDYLETHR